MPEPARFHDHPDLAAASSALAAFLAARIAALLATRPGLSLALPGGRSPSAFLAALAVQDLPWPRLTVLPGDERFVPVTDPESNEGQIRHHFTGTPAAACRLVSLRGTAMTVADAARAAAAAPVFRQPIDLVLCGMGEDGHMASLFPGEAALLADPAALPPVLAVEPPGRGPRLTLSPGMLAGAGWRGLLAAGPAKRAVLDRAAAPGSMAELPVRLLLAAGCDVFFGQAV